MFEQFIKEIYDWANHNIHIKAVLVVGSYARGTQNDASDLDLCIVTTNKEEMLKKQCFANLFGQIEHLQMEYYGACTSIRVWYCSGLEVEFGLVELSWLTLPLDQGTRFVLQDGYRIILDKTKAFHAIDTFLSHT